MFEKNVIKAILYLCLISNFQVFLFILWILKIYFKSLCLLYWDLFSLIFSFKPPYICFYCLKLWSNCGDTPHPPYKNNNCLLLNFYVNGHF